MTALNSVDVAAMLRQQVAEGHPDVLRTLITSFANSLMSAEADAICGAEYGQRSDDRVNSRNGYRAREWDTRAGTGAPVLEACTQIPSGQSGPRRAIKPLDLDATMVR